MHLVKPQICRFFIPENAFLLQALDYASIPEFLLALSPRFAVFLILALLQKLSPFKHSQDHPTSQYAKLHTPYPHSQKRINIYMNSVIQSSTHWRQDLQFINYAHQDVNCNVCQNLVESLNTLCYRRKVFSFMLAKYTGWFPVQIE